MAPSASMTEAGCGRETRSALNMQKLREAQRLDRFVRFRQFQSTTREKALAEKYQAREDGKGYLWIIDIPHGFWGARDIQDISLEKESETLFPPYSAFRVQNLDDGMCHLLAVAPCPTILVLQWGHKILQTLV